MAYCVVVEDKVEFCFVFYADRLLYIYIVLYVHGARGGIVVKALRYKLVGRGFDSWWCHWNFSVT